MFFNAAQTRGHDSYIFYVPLTQLDFTNKILINLFYFRTKKYYLTKKQWNDILFPFQFFCFFVIFADKIKSFPFTVFRLFLKILSIFFMYLAIKPIRKLRPRLLHSVKRESFDAKVTQCRYQVRAMCFSFTSPFRLLLLDETLTACDTTVKLASMRLFGALYMRHE